MGEHTVQDIGQAIASARIGLGLSQEECAKQIGVSRQTWIRMEQGDDRVAFGTVAKALSLTRQYLTVEQCGYRQPQGTANIRQAISQMIGAEL